VVLSNLESINAVLIHQGLKAIATQSNCHYPDEKFVRCKRIEKVEVKEFAQKK
jgi:hypothetical protein